MTIALQAIPLADLRALADSRTPEGLGHVALDGALAPAFVARRSLAQMAAGKPMKWCSTFYILRESDRCLVGSCGFKDAPSNGRVEIGYGVAPACRNQGFATAAVRALLDLAFRSGEVREVLAQVNPDNLASTRVVGKLGFTNIGLQPDREGELVAQWLAGKGR